MISRAYSYTRFSTPQQSEGDSERRQTEAAEAYAKAHGLELDSTYRDLGRSAFSGSHLKEGAMGAFVQLVNNGQIAQGSCLIIEAIDRLSRERFHDAYSLFSRIVRAGISIITLEDNTTYTAANYDELSVIIPLVVKITAAHEYSKRLAARVAPGKQKRVKEARETGRPCTKVCPAWLRVSADGSHFEPIPERVEIVRQIFAWTVLGDGAPNISTRLNKMQAPLFTKSGQGIKIVKERVAKFWSQEFVGNIVNNRSVLGEYQPYIQRVSTNRKRVLNGEPITGYYPAIIDIDTFNAAHEQRTKNKTIGGGGKKGKVSNLFMGLAFCAACSGKMCFVGHGDSRKRHEYLYCHSAMRDGGCTAKGGIPYYMLERTVLSHLEYMDKNGLFAAPSPVAGGEIELEITNISVAIEAANKRLASLMEGEITEPMRRIMVRQSAAVEALEADLKAARQRLVEARPTVSFNDHTEALRALAGKAGTGDVDTRLRVRTALRTIIQKMICDTTGKLKPVSVITGLQTFVCMDNGSSMHMDFNENSDPKKFFKVVQPGEWVKRNIVTDPLLV